MPDGLSSELVVELDEGEGEGRVVLKFFAGICTGKMIGAVGPWHEIFAEGSSPSGDV